MQILSVARDLISVSYSNFVKVLKFVSVLMVAGRVLNSFPTESWNAPFSDITNFGGIAKSKLFSAMRLSR